MSERSLFIDSRGISASAELGTQSRGFEQAVVLWQKSEVRFKFKLLFTVSGAEDIRFPSAYLEATNYETVRRANSARMSEG